MNLPNKLTILRTLMIPVFLFFLLTDYAGDYSKWIAVVVFILASLTVLFRWTYCKKIQSGNKLRKIYGSIGRQIISLFCNDRISWNASFIIYRSDHYYCKRIYHQRFRLVASDNGIVIAASWWGKSRKNNTAR